MATSRKNQARDKKTGYFSPAIKSPLALACRIAAYMNRQDSATDDKGRTRPYTLSGLYIASGMTESSWRDYMSGMHDARLADCYRTDPDGIYHEKDIYKREQDTIDCTYYQDGIRPIVDYLTEGATPEGQEQPCSIARVLQKAKQLVAEQDEERLKIRGQVADIAVMKMCHGWIEEERRTIVHKHEVLPSNDEALEALKQLQLLP